MTTATMEVPVNEKTPRTKEEKTQARKRRRDLNRLTRVAELARDLAAHILATGGSDLLKTSGPLPDGTTMDDVTRAQKADRILDLTDEKS